MNSLMIIITLDTHSRTLKFGEIRWATSNQLSPPPFLHFPPLLPIPFSSPPLYSHSYSLLLYTLPYISIPSPPNGIHRPLPFPGPLPNSPYFPHHSPSLALKLSFPPSSSLFFQTDNRISGYHL